MAGKLSEESELNGEKGYVDVGNLGLFGAVTILSKPGIILLIPKPGGKLSVHVQCIYAFSHGQ